MLGAGEMAVSIPDMVRKKNRVPFHTAPTTLSAFRSGLTWIDCIMVYSAIKIEQ